MKLFGREVKFLFSMDARFRINEIDKDASDDERLVKTALIMANAYDNRQKFLDPKYENKKPLTEEEIKMLNPGEWGELCEAISDATLEGLKVSVEVEGGKKKEDKTKSN